MNMNISIEKYTQKTPIYEFSALKMPSFFYTSINGCRKNRQIRVNNQTPKLSKCLIKLAADSSTGPGNCIETSVI